MQSTHEPKEVRISEEVTPEMILELIQRLTDLLDVSGTGRMAEQINELIMELGRTGNTIDRLRQTLERTSTQEQRLSQIEASLDQLRSLLIEPDAR
jgi:hypothetical protein